MRQNAAPPVVFVTGVSSGIGYYCALALKDAGYSVIGSCRRQEDLKHLRSEGIPCVQLDLADEESVKRGVADFFELSDGKIYGLFNNAGYGQPGAVEDLTRDTLRKQFETNVFGWCQLTNLVLPTMIAQGYGRIIQNSSVLGFAAAPLRGAYVASKFATEGLTDSLRLELRGTGVHVSVINPGPIRSLFRRNALAALQANIVINQSRHCDSYAQTIQRLSAAENQNRFCLEPDAVFQKVFHALSSNTPKARYYVTIPTHVFGFLKRVLSTKYLDVILTRLGA